MSINRINMNYKIKNISSEGRIGKINLEIEGKELLWEWEFGSGKCMIIVSVPNPKEWEDIFTGSYLNRENCLSEIAKKIIKLKCKKCSFKITNNEILFMDR